MENFEFRIFYNILKYKIKSIKFKVFICKKRKKKCENQTKSKKIDKRNFFILEYPNLSNNFFIKNKYVAFLSELNDLNNIFIIIY